MSGAFTCGVTGITNGEAMRREKTIAFRVVGRRGGYGSLLAMPLAPLRRKESKKPMANSRVVESIGCAAVVEVIKSLKGKKKV